MGAPKPGSFRSAWRHRRWRSLLVSYAVSTIGDFLFTVALVVYLIDETGSAGWVAASVIARIAVATVLGPIGGVIADRYDRRRLMVQLDLGRAVVMAGACAAVAVGAPPLLTVALTVVAAALGTAYRPAAVAATPLLVTEDDLATANAAEATVGQLAWFAGPALGAVVVAVSGVGAAFAVNAVTFLVSAALIARVGNIGTGSHDAAGNGEAPGMVASLREGTAALRSEPGLAALTLLLAAILFAYGVEQVVHVLVAKDRLDLGPDGVGLLIAGQGVGGLLAAPFAARLAGRQDAGLALALSGVLLGVPLALLAVTSSLVVASALMVLEGMGNVVLDVLFITVLQRACPDALLGRVFALQDSGAALAQLLGTIAAPLLLAAVDLEATLVIGGGILMVVSMATIPSMLAIARRTEAERARLRPVTTRLAGLGIFDDASPAALERLARAARLVPVAPGTVIVEEGADADELFVMVSGEARVSNDAEGHIRMLGPDDWFGEIGLLRGMARTATVTAVGDVEVLAIPGPVFVAAVSGDSPLSDPLRRTMNARLLRTHPHLAEPAA